MTRHLLHQGPPDGLFLLRAAPGDLVARDLVEHRAHGQVVHLKPGQPRLSAAVIQPRGAYGASPFFRSVSTSRSVSPAMVEKMARTAAPSVTSITSAGAQGSGSGTSMPMAAA